MESSRSTTFWRSTQKATEVRQSFYCNWRRERLLRRLEELGLRSDERLMQWLNNPKVRSHYTDAGELSLRHRPRWFRLASKLLRTVQSIWYLSLNICSVASRDRRDLRTHRDSSWFSQYEHQRRSTLWYSAPARIDWRTARYLTSAYCRQHAMMSMTYRFQSDI